MVDDRAALALGLVAACAFASLGCSSASSSDVSGDAASPREAGSPADAGSGSDSNSGSDSASDSGSDSGSGSATTCDAGEPANPYATSQPFECNESLQTIPTRTPTDGGPPVTLAFDLVVPHGTPTAIVILLAGGSGVLNLTQTGIGTSADNFVVRTRQMFAAAGFVAAIPDTPSDHPQGLDGFRASQAHAKDIGALVKHLRSAPGYGGLPVWLVSTSRGTISATDALARLAPPQRPDHVVLTSSVTVIPDAGNVTDPEDIDSVPDAASALSAAVPVLMIDDSEDRCGASPPAGAAALASGIGDPASAFVLVDGGPMPPDGGDPCGATAYHGFYEQDGPVVNGIIVPFIEKGQ